VFEVEGVLRRIMIATGNVVRYTLWLFGW